MALTLQELLLAQAELKAKDEAAADVPKSMSMAQLKELAGGDVASVKKSGVVGDSNLVKIFQELKVQTKILQDLSKTDKKQAAGSTREDRMEDQREVLRQSDLLAKIEENTRGFTEAKKKEEKESKGLDLGGWATALAVAIGGFIAMIQAQVKTIQLFARALLPEAWLNALSKKTASFLAGLSMQYDLAKSAVIEKFNVARKFVEGIVDSVKTFFSGDGAIVSAVRKIYGVIKNVFTTIAEPFVELYKYVKKVAGLTEAFSPITEFFGGIGKWFSKFGSLITKSAKILGKVFYPLTVIMTLWDTVKGAIEGFEKDGIIGGIAGAIKGFINSLIMAPLDMLKNAVSWILGAFGFDKAEEFLDSFSFEELFTDFVDAIFSPIETLKKMFDGAVKVIENIGIPEISFTIPIIDKKVSIGPFYPFKKEGAQEGSVQSAAPAGEIPVPAGRPGSPSANIAARQARQAEEAKGGTQLGETPAFEQAPVQKSGETIAAPLPSGAQQSTEAISQPASGAQNNSPFSGINNAYNKAINPNVGAIPGLGAVSQGISGALGGINSMWNSAVNFGKTPPQDAAAVYNQSGQNAGMSGQQSSAPVVVAPTTNNNVNNTTNSITRIPTRNDDPSLAGFYRSRYAV